MGAIESSKSHRLYLLLKERIQSGAIAAGARLPSEQQLGEAFEVSRITVRRALDGLDRDGLVTRQAGSGTYALQPSAPRHAIVGDLLNMISSLVAMGRETQVRLLSFNYVVPPEQVASALKMVPGEKAQHALRVRTLDGLPFSYLATHVPESIGVQYSDAELSDTPLLGLLERSGVVVSRADQTLSATLAGPEAAEVLDVEIGAPLISMTRVILGPDGRGVEHLSALYRPDRYQFHMQMERTGSGGSLHWRIADPSPKPPSRRRAVRRMGGRKVRRVAS